MWITVITTSIIPAFISAVVAAIFWTFKDKILYKRTKNKERLDLLNSLYKDMVVVSQGLTNFNHEEMNYKMHQSIGNLGFHLRVFFPNLFNRDYEDCINKILTLKFEADMKKLNNQFNDEYLKSFTTKMIEAQNLVKIVFDSFVKEAEKYK